MSILEPGASNRSVPGARVVHLTSAHPRDDIRIFVKQCRSLADNGYDTHLVVADGIGDAEVEGVHIHDVGTVPGRLGRMVKATTRVWQAARVLKGDLYHLHDPELLPFGWRLKRAGGRVIFDAHEDVPKQLLSKPYLHPAVLRVLSSLFARVERYACSRFDGIIAATPTIRDKFARINARSVDINNFPILGELDAALPWSAKASEVCYIGTIAAIRGVRELVRALEHLNSPIRLHLVGGFSEPAVETEVQGYPGWSKVINHGVLSRTGVRDVLARSLAGLVTLHPLANYLDALPIKMFEYMSAGIPVIASDFPLWRAIVSEVGCGLVVDPRSPEQIAQAIEYIASHPQDARRMGENGRAAVQAQFNWRTEKDKLLGFYGELIGY